MQDQELKAVVAVTTQCPFAFSCLENGRCGPYSLCDGDHLLSERVLCTQCAEKLSCPYQLHFPYAQFCICPLRLELWKEFGNHWCGLSTQPPAI